MTRSRRVPTASFWIGAILGGGLAYAACELPYINWSRVASPIDTQPLTIREDAGGDGRFLARRSGGHRHRGVDLVATLDSPVRAIRSGTVVQIGDHRGLGRFVELEHHHQLHSLYAHLSKVNVDVGERVRQGEMLGAVGKTGNARHSWITPHVHLEVLKQGQPIDPQMLGLRLTSSKEHLVSGSDALIRAEGSDASGGD